MSLLDGYKARDALRVPGLLSLSRIPLALAFAFVVERPALALAILVTAGLTDVLDGWYARRFDQVTATGAALDPTTDKLFVLAVAITLLVKRELSVASLLLLSTREMGEVPLLLWVALRPGPRGKGPRERSANVPGKVATALQFVSVALVVVRAPHQEIGVCLTALAGCVAVFAYWRRAIVATRAAAG